MQQQYLCLACSSTIPANVKPASVYVHGCCSRSVCSTCLTSNPRLVTFCPICEDATAAFRKGPRNDVTRKGDVLFDVQALLDREQAKEQERIPPPPYSESKGEEDVSGKFVVEEDTESEQEKVKPTGKQPSLLTRQASKSCAGAEVDVSAHPADALTADDSESSSKLISHRRKVDPHNTTGASSCTSSSTARDNGATRQYYLGKTDTLQSIAIRFCISSNELCLLNSLPRAVLSTSPHLLHTRSFILLPSHAVEKQLATNPGLEQSLQGPPRKSANEKTIAARRTAEAKFRATLAKRAGETPADERAAKAYVGLAEDEMRWVDFGEGLDELGLSVGCEANARTGRDDNEMWEAQQDTARRCRFDAILKHALGKWEMDSDWERAQRAQGLDPSIISNPPTASASSGFESESNSKTSHYWFTRALHSHQPGESSSSPRRNPRHVVSLSSSVKLPTLLKKSFEGAHKAPINVARYSSTGRYLLTGSTDRTVKLWNVGSPAHDSQPISTYTEHNYAVHALDVCADNSRFVSAGLDKSLYVWDVSASSVVRRFSGHSGKINDVRFAGNDGDGSVIVAAGWDGVVRVYDLRAQGSWKPIMELREATDAITSLSVSQAKIYSGCVDGVVRTYDVRAGQLKSDTFPAAVTSIAPSKLETSMLVATLDSTLRLLDTRDGTLLQSYQGHQHQEYRCRAVFGADEEGIVIGDERGRLVGWDMVSGESVRVGDKEGEEARRRPVLWVEFHPQDPGEMVSAGADGVVRVWSTASG